MDMNYHFLWENKDWRIRYLDVFLNESMYKIAHLHVCAHIYTHV